jgi:predicted deacylase
MNSPQSKVKSTISLPPMGIGSSSTIQALEWFPSDVRHEATDPEFFSQDRAYIQASLHADELPGMLVAHHLVKLVDAAAAQGKIRKQITIVPYANPIGLNQFVMGGHLGRFSISTGTKTLIATGSM